MFDLLLDTTLWMLGVVVVYLWLIIIFGGDGSKNW